jgi:hypothetical protein
MSFRQTPETRRARPNAWNPASPPFPPSPRLGPLLAVRVLAERGEGTSRRQVAAAPPPASLSGTSFLRQNPRTLRHGCLPEEGCVAPASLDGTSLLARPQDGPTRLIAAGWMRRPCLVGWNLPPGKTPGCSDTAVCREGWGGGRCHGDSSATNQAAVDHAHRARGQDHAPGRREPPRRPRIRHLSPKSCHSSIVAPGPGC